MSAPHHVPAPPAVVQPAAPVASVSLDLEAADLSLFIRTLTQVTGRPRFALSPAVVADGKKLSAVLSGDPSSVWADGVSALDLAGVRVSCVGSGGLCRFSEPPASPAPSDQAKAGPVSVLAYSPLHRTVGFLASQVGPMFPDWHFNGASAAAGVGAAGAAATVSAASGTAQGGSGAGGAISGRATDQEAVAARLVGLGPRSSRDRLLSVLVELDQLVPALTVRCAVYEFDLTKSANTPAQTVVSVLQAVLGNGVTASASSSGLGTEAVTLRSVNFSAVLSALDSSSIAHLVTAPVLRTSSGVVASFAVGDSVPTVGSVSYAGSSSTPVQSIQYQQSGVVFSVLPQVVGSDVDLSLYQSVSSFVATTTGVSSSPTLQNRALASQMVARPGSIYVLGGLAESSESRGRQGLFGLNLPGESQGKNVTSIVLVIQLDITPP